MIANVVFVAFVHVDVVAVAVVVLVAVLLENVHEPATLPVTALSATLAYLMTHFERMMLSIDVRIVSNFRNCLEDFEIVWPLLLCVPSPWYAL